MPVEIIRKIKLCSDEVKCRRKVFRKTHLHDLCGLYTHKKFNKFQMFVALKIPDGQKYYHLNSHKIPLYKILGVKVIYILQTYHSDPALLT